MERDHAQPRGRREMHGRSPTNVSRSSSSPLTQIRRAWNVRVAGSMRCHPRPGSRAARSRPARRSSLPPAGSPRWRERCDATDVLAKPEITSASSVSLAAFTRSAAVGPLDRSIRMSSGSSRLKLNPRRRCRTAATTPRGRRGCRPPRDASLRQHRGHPDICVHQHDAVGNRAAASRQFAAPRDRDRSRWTRVAPRTTIASVCPPRPTVQSR